MIKELFLATNNQGKIERFKKLMVQIGPEIKIFTPSDFHLETLNPEESADTLEGNALIKARAYKGKVAMPILSNDGGYYVEGEGLISAPKRVALGAIKEEDITKEEKKRLLLEFWKGIASKHGGKVDAAWLESFVLITPDGVEKTADSRREVILTNQEFGEAHIDLPVRALYISKATGKPAVLHTSEEEIFEMQPLISALRSLLNP